MNGEGMNTYPLRVSGKPLNRVVPREYTRKNMALVPMGARAFDIQEDT